MMWGLMSSDVGLVQYLLLLLLKCCFTSTKTVGLLGTGAQDGHLDFHTAPGLLSAQTKNGLVVSRFGLAVRR